ncbi:FAD-dependent oxidoreductase [Thalassotalea psychrophila]|uniref:FAD-dependent oxidoreductase n=1 Tax=Thalassotalea psychrophila TaxID=3065647 RepID=A0ABY9TUF7_9GAMM|nr:FAD-dependent oxidoreductase [Colwelliaceae bacterium SQ149]
MKNKTKVVIVGGGAMGCGLAYHLAEEGWTDIMLIEKAELTSGSTWHAAGQCPSFTGSYNLAKLHEYSNTLYPKLEELTGQYVGWHECGGIRLAFTDEEVDWFKRVAGFSHNVGFHMEVISPERIKELVPHLNVDGVKAGAYTASDGHVDPAGIANAMAIGARKKGAEIVRHNLVLDINQLPSGEWEVVTEKGNIICEHVVNAAGCYARQVAQMVGCDVPMTNMLHQYFVTDSVKEFEGSDAEMPVIRDPSASAYYRQEQKSALMGIYETDPQWAEEAWAPKGHPEWESESELFTGSFDKSLTHLEKVLERMPIWAESGFKRIVHGAIPHTPDANPLLGPAPGLKNYWMCNGSAIGIAQGAGAGKYLAQWMVHGEAEINMAEFDPRRFGNWCNEDYVREKSFEDYNRMYAFSAPGEELDTGRKLRTSPLYQILKTKNCIYTQAFGWERPKWFAPEGVEETVGYKRSNSFESVANECKAVRERVGVMDLSSFAKFEVSGPDAGEFINKLTANKLPKQNGIVLTHALNKNGVFETEFTITRLAEDKYYLLSGSTCESRDWDLLNQRKDEVASDADVTLSKVTIKNVSDDYGILVLAGPDSRKVLEKITEDDVSKANFKWLTGREITVAGIELVALKLNYVGELGWELHCPMDKMVDLYQAIFAAGTPFGIADFGMYAVNSMRMEKAYKGFGTELTNEITMVEADMGRFYKLDQGEFVGKDALLQRIDQGAAIKCVYLQIDAIDADVYGGEAVFSADNKVIGVATSGGYGHIVKQSLAFAYVDAAFSAADTVLQVEILGEMCQAKVLADPLWDPACERSRS